MTYKEYVKSMTTKEIIEELESMEQLINGKVCCYSVKDLILRDYLEDELEIREYGE